MVKSLLLAGVFCVLIRGDVCFAKSEQKQVSSNQNIVVHLEQRDYKITISSGKTGPVYTVKDPSGEVLAKMLTEKELQAKLPKVHKLVRNALAGGEKKHKLDASVRTEPIQ